MLRSLLASLAVLALTPLPGAAQSSKLDFPGFAASFFETHGIDPKGKKFLAVLDGPAFLRVDIGAYDLCIPLDSVEDSTSLGLMKEAIQVLIDVQRAWQSWRRPALADEAEADWKTVEKWVKSWSGKKLGRCEGGGESLYVQLAAKESVVGAAANLRELASPTPATVRRLGALNVTVLAPTRKHFLELAGVAGVLSKAKQRSLWHDGMIRMGAAWVDWVQLIALVSTDDHPDYDHPLNSISYSATEKTGLAQHVADRGAIHLLRKEFYQRGTHFFEESLGTNLVIAAVGRNGVYSTDWNIQWRTAGGSTQPYTRFVPGAGPAGGILPARKARAGPTTFSVSGGAEESRYRANAGVGFFASPLRDGQKNGFKMASRNKEDPLRGDKLPHFQLYSLSEHETTVVTAPFLGKHSEEKQLPDNAFLDDYEDFFRAYRSCFIEWMRTHAAGDEETSDLRFGELIERQRKASASASLDDAVLELYGVPYSTPDITQDSLERRYLEWLRKGR
jgi:hypothetical protein